MSRVITGPLTISFGPLTDVRVTLNRDDARSRRTHGRPVPTPIEVVALIDTGAECSAVSPTVVSRLGLPLVTARLTNAPGLGGLSITPIRDASFILLHPDRRRSLHLNVWDIEVVELDIAAAGCDAVIGRDILARCTFTYNGRTNSFSLSY
jgi:hypothetical protein